MINFVKQIDLSNPCCPFCHESLYHNHMMSIMWLDCFRCCGYPINHSIQFYNNKCYMWSFVSDSSRIELNFKQKITHLLGKKTQKIDGIIHLTPISFNNVVKKIEKLIAFS